MLRVVSYYDNNSAQFSKTDELVSYLIGNHVGTLSDTAAKQDWSKVLARISDPIVNGNSGVFAISATLTDKGVW